MSLPAAATPNLERAQTPHLAGDRRQVPLLDGLRGLSALYVVLHHAYNSFAYADGGAHLDAVTRVGLGWLAHGHYAVVVFIVLSGYCLMNPLVQQGTTRLDGGVEGFFARRARRVLPAYYAALGLSLLLILAVPALRDPQGVRWDVALPGLTRGNIAAHLLLLHNLQPDFIYKINYPFWSVATEWQIYGVFALILLPAYRRAGVFGALVAAVVTAVLLWLTFGYFTGAGFHLIVGFALGMGAAVLTSPWHNEPLRRLGDRVPWGLTTSVLLAGLIAARTLLAPFLDRSVALDDTFAGCVTLSLLVYAVKARRAGTSSILVRLLESRLTLGLGAFSYSLYLTHAPVIALAEALIRRTGAAPSPSLWALTAASLPLCLLTGYGFYRLFERPFLRRRA